MIPVNMYARPINTQPIPIRTLPLKMNHTPNIIHKVANTRYLTRPGLGSELFGALRFMRTSLREADHAEVAGVTERRAHPDRDARLRYLAAEVAAPAADGWPVMPVDAKKGGSRRGVQEPWARKSSDRRARAGQR